MEVQLKMISRETARRQRAFRRAAAAWQSGKPHKAWEILDADGLGDPQTWREFQRQALQRARRTYQVRMARG
jgi:hypothetical protein